MKKAMVLLCVALGLVLLPVSQVLAFHEHGVARCSGCHTMHNHEDSTYVDPAHPNGNPYLLRLATASDMCLSCHATSRGAVWGSDPLNPPLMKGAGNFAWLNVPNLNDGRNGNQPANYIPGYKGGHSVVAPSKNAVADPVHTVSPGGTYPSSAMSCTSCHDPHGNEAFRMLYGVGHVEAGNYTFTHEAPACQEGPPFSNTTDAESPTLHTAYNGGMSQWCSNCHGQYHQDGAYRHPSGVPMSSSVQQTYGLYQGTENWNAGIYGNAATSYIPQVAFEDPDMTPTSTAGPGANSQVSCITCHRAHGANSPNNGRWDFNVTSQGEDGRYAYTTILPAPYNAATQRSLCNKCHAKDAGDEPYNGQ